MELAEGGDLKHQLKKAITKKARLQERLIWRVVYQGYYLIIFLPIISYLLIIKSPFHYLHSFNYQ